MSSRRRRLLRWLRRERFAPNRASAAAAEPLAGLHFRTAFRTMACGRDCLEESGRRDLEGCAAASAKLFSLRYLSMAIRTSHCTPPEVLGRNNILVSVRVAEHLLTAGVRNRETIPGMSTSSWVAHALVCTYAPPGAADRNSDVGVARFPCYCTSETLPLVNVIFRSLYT